ncbi:MAG: NYN domain-containing protein [bacterium]
MSLLTKILNNEFTDNEIGVLYVFIDSSNLWAAQKSKGKMFDYEKLIGYIKEKFKPSIIKVFYYVAYPAEGTRDYSLDGKHKFFTFLEKGLGFVVRKKELKRIKIVSDLGESVKEKGDMDVWITVDAMHHLDKYNTAIFFTGDSDFLPLISYLNNSGKKVFIFSSKNNVSEELRKCKDGYCDVLNINGIWGRDLIKRKQ